MFKLVEGLGSELSLINTIWLVFVVVAVVAIMIKLGMVKMPGNNKKPRTLIRTNPSSLPGNAKECIEHGKQLERLETIIKLKFEEQNRRIGKLEKKIDNNRRQ